MKTLIVDWSPVIYGNLFSATNVIKKDKYFDVPKIDGKYDLDKYEDLVILKIFEELISLRNKFNLSPEDEIVIATDTSKDGYWRKDVWAGYKSKRKKARDDSDVMWDKAFKIFEKINDIINKCTSYKLISVPRSEGDDIIFVLSEYLSLEGKEVIIYSSDHDFIQCLKHQNVQFWRTTRTQGMENSSFYEITDSELEDIIMEHIIQGDSGDDFGNIKQYSRFSKEFLKVFPQLEGKELQAYPKRFQIDVQFEKKYGVSAYNHPRYGYKMFLRSKKTVKEILAENPIYKMNYEMNRRLALPEMIDTNISESILESYHKSNNNRDPECLMNFFMNNNLLDLAGQIHFI
jgi:5'-3' exonuclease